MIIRTFKPRRRHNLYDSSKHNNFSGVLIFNYDRQSNKYRLNDETIQPNNLGEENVVVPTENEVIQNNEIQNTESLSEQFIRFAFRVDAAVMALLKKLKQISIMLIDFTVWILEEIRLWIGEKLGILGKLIAYNTVKSKRNVKIYGSQLKNGKKLARQIISEKQPRLNFKFDYNFRQLNFAKIKLSFAVVFLIISFFSIAILISPLVLAQLSQSFQSSPSITKIKPTPTPLAYNSYYQPEQNPLYPITEFRIEIPSIKLESNIVDNVDTNIEDEYKSKLQYGVAHAKGTYLPPENGGPTYLFAHSTDTVFNIARFNAKFFSVRELKSGDEIKVFFNGKEYDYIVKSNFIIEPTEIDVIRNSDTDLILQTCWPPGTSWQRLIVFADRKEASDSARSI